METADYADIEQGERLDFSIEFNDETGKITIFDGEDFICRGMREMLFLQQMEEMERTAEILEGLNDHKPPEQTSELKEQNYNMADNVPNNGAGEKAQIEENKKPQEKPAGRVSLKERLAQMQAIVSGKGNEQQEGKEKNHREM